MSKISNLLKTKIIKNFILKKNEKLAIFGGKPTLKSNLPPYSSINNDEFKIIKKVFKRGQLSGFYGSWGEEFFGGYEVKRLEKSWSEFFKVPYSISVNSATSGLYAALAAIGISPGDEVIVPPYTMSATTMGPLLYGGIPVFVDIDPNTFCLDTDLVKKAITEKTKAIIAVNLFGHPANLDVLKKICEDHNLKLIEDNAQAPLAKINGQFTGTIGDIGIFSLNYHKHIHCGEGGICVTRDKELAFRLQAVRNHGENIVEPKNISPVNMVGFNYRMTEMSAAVAFTQLKKIRTEVSKRKKLAEFLSDGIKDLEGLQAPLVQGNCEHVYYAWALKINEEILGISRNKFSQALLAEGFPLSNGYVKPLYLLPAFQKRIAIGENGWPFNLTERIYKKGLCPVTESMFESELITFETCNHKFNKNLAKKLVEAIRKVHSNRRLLN